MKSFYVIRFLPVAITVMLLTSLIIGPSFVLADWIWGNDQAIGATDHEAAYPVVATNGMNAVAVWIQYNPENTCARVYSRYSIDGGQTWSAAQMIDTDTGKPASVYHAPSVIMAGWHVLAVWQQQNKGSRESVFCNYSADGGTTWQNSAVLIHDGNDGEAYAPHAAMSGRYAVAIWQQFDGPVYDGISRICISRSSDYGAVWGTPLPVENETVYPNNQVLKPRIAINGQHVVAVWHKFIAPLQSRIFSNYSSNYGAGWNSVCQLNGDIHARFPYLGLSLKGAVAVWGDKNGNIYSRYSPDCGANWQNAMKIDAGAGYTSGHKVAVDGTNAVAVWTQEDDGGIYRVYRNYSHDGGDNWVGATLIEDNEDYSSDVAVDISGATVFAVWTQYDGTRPRLNSNCSFDGGLTWNIDRLIEDNEEESAKCPQVAVSALSAVAVWQIRGRYEGNGVEIYSNYASFQPGSQMVGGEMAGIDSLKVASPWLAALIGMLVPGGTALILRRRKRHT
ncbi:MAG: exo-alpha-sialidase [Dehalococcoidales bacterium]|nr:exo-alpha-sialidase [Dehalococcoidales bacterium]